MKTLAVLAVTHGGMDETDESQWSVSSMKTLDGTRVGPAGSNALAWMAQFNYVMMWHWPSIHMVNELASLGTAVIPFIEIDAIKTYPEWNPINENLRQSFLTSLGGRMMSSKENSFGHPFVDYYETSSGTWNEKPHTHAIDIDNARARAVYIERLRKVWDMYEAKPLAVVVDSMNTRRYFGTATNVPSGQGVLGWEPWTREIQKYVCPVWAHSGGMFPNTGFCVSEWSLRDKSVYEVAMEVMGARRDKVEFCLAPNDGQRDVDKLDTLENLGFAPGIVQTARSGMWYVPKWREDPS